MHCFGWSSCAPSSCLHGGSYASTAGAQERSALAQAPTVQDRKTNREVREETGGNQEPTKLLRPGSWGELQRNRILERCGSELRRLNKFIACEHLSLPGSSNVLALSYRETEPDVRRARLVRERQSRETADRMERCQSTGMDASAWADTHHAEIRGRNRTSRRGGLTAGHPFIDEVHQAARNQKEDTVSDWLEEAEPEQEPEPELEPEPSQTQDRRIGRGDHAHALRTDFVAARGNLGQCGRRNSRGSRYQQFGQRGQSQRKRLPQTASTGSSLRTGARASTDTKRTYRKRRRNSSNSTSISSLEDYQTPRNQLPQSPAPQMTASGSITRTSSIKETTTPRPANPGQAVMLSLIHI